MAIAAVDSPEGRVLEVIYPVASVAKLKAMIEEDRAKGTLDRRIQTVMRGSYASHYRRMVPPLLAALRFRSNNASRRPILDALDLIERWQQDGRRVVPADLAPQGSIPAKWREGVIDASGRLNVITFELSVLAELREQVRAKEIWVDGANRYATRTMTCLPISKCKEIHIIRALASPRMPGRLSRRCAMN